MKADSLQHSESMYRIASLWRCCHKPCFCNDQCYSVIIHLGRKYEQCCTRESLFCVVLSPMIVHSNLGSCIVCKAAWYARLVAQLVRSTITSQTRLWLTSAWHDQLVSHDHVHCWPQCKGSAQYNHQLSLQGAATGSTLCLVPVRRRLNKTLLFLLCQRSHAPWTDSAKQLLTAVQSGTLCATLSMLTVHVCEWVLSLLCTWTCTFLQGPW